MVEYVVDYLGFQERQWWSGDQEDWEPKAYPKEKYRGKTAEPFNITLTKHCDVRSQDGWRLHSVVPRAESDWPSGFVKCLGVWLFFERERS
jgi:hypothetical protein